MTPKQTADYLIQNRRACRTRRGSPCPVCGKTDSHCLRLDDDSAALCPKANGAGSVRRYGEYGHLYLLSSGLATQDAVPLVPVKAGKERTDMEQHAIWARRAQRWFENGKHEAYRLATVLGVAAWALDELQVGWDGKAWTFPERNAEGLIVGVNRRFEDGAKRCATGSRRGLTYSDKWRELSGPVLVVEGGSDVAAGITMGLSAIGRPSNTGGAPLLRVLLAGCGRKIVVVGERDRQPDKTAPGKMRWPGIEGARSVARQLRTFGSSVSVRLLPDNAKDLRGWLVARNESDQSARYAAGVELAERMGR